MPDDDVVTWMVLICGEATGLSGDSGGAALPTAGLLGQPGCGCFLMCSARWSEREKQRSHSLHWNGLAPVCFR